MASPPPGRGPSDDSENGYAIDHASNFRAIYQDAQLRAAFYLFLKNVYHLYPEDDFHELILSAAQSKATDREIYELAQARLSDVKPVLGDVRYSLPALSHQKTEMTRQTLALLGDRPAINGYMEIGTTGRYISRLQSSMTLTGDLVLLNLAAPTYSFVDVVERGQLSKLGRFVPLNNYLPLTASDVPDRSLDVVANFIGFHHSPPERRDAFISSVVRTLRPGGRLILRDHNVDSTSMNHMVALAHDVFNMGLGVPWEANQREIRNFTSISEMQTYLGGFGLKAVPGKQPLLQDGDPTHNALMEFIKI